MGEIHEKKIIRNPVPRVHKGFGCGKPNPIDSAWRFSRWHETNGICGTIGVIERSRFTSSQPNMDSTHYQESPGRI